MKRKRWWATAIGIAVTIIAASHLALSRRPIPAGANVAQVTPGTTRVCVVFANGKPTAFSRLRFFSDKKPLWPERIPSENSNPINVTNLEPWEGEDWILADEEISHFRLTETKPKFLEAFGVGLDELLRAHVAMGGSGCADIDFPTNAPVEIFYPNYYNLGESQYEKIDYPAFRVKVKPLKTSKGLEIQLSNDVKPYGIQFASDETGARVDSYNLTSNNDCFVVDQDHDYHYSIFSKATRKQYSIPAPTFYVPQESLMSYEQVMTAKDRFISIYFGVPGWNQLYLYRHFSKRTVVIDKHALPPGG